MIRMRLITACLLPLAVGLLTFRTAGSHAAGVQTTLYVASNGNDANPGIETAPFATIEKARQTVRTMNRDMRGDIVVVLRDGVYRIGHTLVFESADSGHNGHNVVYRAAMNETPVISGGKRITGWQPDRGNRWKAKTDLDDFRQLYVGGLRAIRARSGKLGGQTNAGFWEFLPDPSHSGALKGAELIGTQGYRTTAVEMADWHNPSDIEFCYVGNLRTFRIGEPPSWPSWCHTYCKVKNITREGNHAVVTMLQPYFTHARTKNGLQVELPDYIENALELLDEPGEWYFDRSTKLVYYIPRPGEDLRQVEVIAPAVERLVELRGTLDQPIQHIRFEGITFRHGSWLRPSRIGHCDVQANFVFDPDRKDSHLQEGRLRNPNDENLKSPANVVCHAARSIRFDRCTFTQLGGAGLDIEFGSQENVVRGCQFCDISGSAVQVGDVRKDDHHPDDPRKIVKDNSVVNCYIHDCGVQYMDSVGIFAGYTEGTRIAHNEICRLPYSGISIGWGWGQEDAGGGAHHQPFRYPTPTPAQGNRIEFNHIHHVVRPMQDGGGIYVLGNQPDTTIRGNHIHDNAGYPGGIYLDEGSGFIEITGNLVYNTLDPMWFGNAAQYRRATCKEHGNWFGSAQGDAPDATKAIVKGDVGANARLSIINSAGLETDHRDLLDDDLAAFRREFRVRSSLFPNDPEAFRHWQKSYRAHLTTWLMDGGLPSRVPLDAKLLETRDFSTFTLRRVQYHSQEDRTNTLLISLPKGVAKAPVLLALHGHENAWGQAAENAYRMGDADDFCAYFAERGWIVVQPATMNHTLHHKDWTLQGEWTWDAMVALDYVATHSEADMDRVAVCGLSTGGHLAMNVLALDDRVKAGVVGCQLSTWNHYRLRMRIPPHCDCGVSKQLGDRLEQCDWAALAAPKPVQFQHGHKDPCYCPGADPKLLNPDWNVAVMPVAEYDTMFAEVQRAYRLASRPENVCTRFHDGGHKVDSEMALRWLQERLVRTVTP